MTGTAEWFVGPKSDTGPVKLLAKATGENRAEFDLSNGSRIESQGAIDGNRSCTWTGKDGVVHDMTLSNCSIAIPWFIPGLALQNASYLPSSLEMQNAVGDKGFPHVIHDVNLAVVPRGQKLAAQIRVWSATDTTLDPATHLPVSLQYTIHPDNDDSIDLKVAISYSNYQNVSGVMVPMHIERRVNGNLQVKIDITSATIN